MRRAEAGRRHIPRGGTDGVQVDRDSLPWIGSYSSPICCAPRTTRRVELEIHVSDCLPGSVRSWMTPFSLSITGLFIFPVRQRVDFRLVGLGRLFMAKANAEVLSRRLPKRQRIRLSWDNDAPPVNAYRNDSLAADISSALSSHFERKKLEDMAQSDLPPRAPSPCVRFGTAVFNDSAIPNGTCRKNPRPNCPSYPGWKLLLEADVSRKAGTKPKGQPLRRALKSLVAIKEHSPDARVCYAENLTDTIGAQFGGSFRSLQFSVSRSTGLCLLLAERRASP